MPKERFFTLDETKREKIIREALIEFGFKVYDMASISVLVKKCGISKGSVYLYFEDKLELYVHLLTTSLEQRKAYTDTIKREDFSDFWSFYRSLFEAWFRFDKDFPLESKFLINVYHNLNSASSIEFYNDYISETLSSYDKFVDYELGLNNFRSDIDPNIISTFLYTNTQQVFRDITTYYSSEQVVSPNLSLINIDLKISMQILEYYLELMKAAISTY